MITYRIATCSDNQQLIELTAASGMAGDIGLRIDRAPDFFSLLHQRGETKVFVAEDNGKIIGCICVSLQQVYVGEEILPLYYIGDFKVAASYQNKGIGLQLCNEMADYVIGMNADLAFLNVSKGNTKPLSFFKNRPGVPDFENIGVFNIHQFVGKKKTTALKGFTIIRVPVSAELVNFFNKHNSTYQLANVITAKKLDAGECFVIKQNNEIIAATCLCDMMGLKQNVVTRISWRLKYILKAINAVKSMTGLSKMPEVNKPVGMLYIKYFAVKSCDKEMIHAMISHARNIVYQKSYSFVSIGLHEKDPLNKYLHGLMKLTFNSVGMLVSIKNNKAIIEKVKQGIPFEDYSLV